MRTYSFDDDYMSGGDCSGNYLSNGECNCGQCDDHDDSFYDEEEMYDDPYEVVMYDIDIDDSDDLHSLIFMLNDTARAWYAKRRLSALSASGPLHALVADIIIDSLGRRWNPLLHPRDRFGQFIETGGFFRWFMNGIWQRGQVIRIDSDGMIHARSKGNDRIPDGAPLKFSNKQASKLVSTADEVADLTPEPLPDFDAEIPDFPEASLTQRRIYNALAWGDIPGEDLTRFRAEGESSGIDIGNQIAELQEKNLVLIDNVDGKPRVRRADHNQLGVLDIFDDIDDVPDDETPDLDDSPALSKSQRALIDAIEDADRGEGDGVTLEEIEGATDEDLQALVDAGVLSSEDGERFHLVNPEGSSEDAVETPGEDIGTAEERDVVDEIDKAAKARFPGNLEQQEAFYDRAAELAGLAEEDDNAEYGRDEKRARNAAESWWEEFNAPETDEASPQETEPSDLGEAEDVPEADTPEPDTTRRTNSELAKELAEVYFPHDAEDPLNDEDRERLEAGLTALFNAEDYEKNGETTRASLTRNVALQKLRSAGVPEKELKGWVDEVRDFKRDENSLIETPETVEDVAPETRLDPLPDSIQEIDEELEAINNDNRARGPEWSEYLSNRIEELNKKRASLIEDDQGETDDDLDEQKFLEEQQVLDEEAARLEQALSDEFDADADADADGFDDSSSSDIGRINGRGIVPMLEELRREGLDGDPRFFSDEERTRRAEIESKYSQDSVLDEDLIRELDGINFNQLGKWADWSGRVHDRRDEDHDLVSTLEDERIVAEDMGLDFNDPDGIDSWTKLDEDLGREKANELYEEFEGDLTRARLNHLIRQNGGGTEEALNRENAENDLDRVLAEEDVIDGRERNWKSYDTLLMEEGPEANFVNRLDQEIRIANELGLDHNDENAPWSWNNLVKAEGFEAAREMFIQNDGNLGQAMGRNLRGRQSEDRVPDVDGPDSVDGTPDSVIVPVTDITPASENPIHQRIVRQEPLDLDAFPALTDSSGGLVDAEGVPVELGKWYGARAGGGGDPLEAVAFIDQNEYPGWFIGRRPDGKLKAVHVLGEGRGRGGIRQWNTGEDGDIPNWKAQNRIEIVDGHEILVDKLDQFKEGNKMANGEAGKVGMVVEYAGDRKNAAIKPGERVVINRIGIVPIKDRRGEIVREEIRAYVILPGSTGRDQEKGINIGLLKPAEFLRTPTPDTPTPAPSPDIPENSPLEIPVGEWADMPDLDLVDMVRNLGVGRDDGWVDMVDFVNAHQNGGQAFEQINRLKEAGDLEFHPDGINGRPALRVRNDVNAPDVAADLPEVDLPRGANNEFEAAVLRAIDEAGDVGVRRVDFVDDDDAGEKLLAMRELANRGVLEEVTDPNGGRPFYRRAPEPEVVPSSGSRTNDASRGYDAGGVEMSHSEAVSALQAGADPMTIKTDSLYRAMHDSGRFEFRAFKNQNIGDTEWAIDNQVNGPFIIDAKGRTSGRVYFVKNPAETSPRGNWRSELYAGAISQFVGASENDPGSNTGFIYHPQTTSVSGNRIMADHAAYNFPAGTEIGDLGDFTGEDLAKAAPDRVRLALFDYLINNSIDRHAKNQMYARLPDGSMRVVLIDNGFGDGENFEFNDPTNHDLYGFINSSRHFARTRELLQDVGDLNEGLTRDDLRDIVRSFAASYGSIDPEAILNLLIQNNSLDANDVASFRTWLQVAKERIDIISRDPEEIVRVLAETIGI